MKAMIFAAGRGDRMRPLTDTTPKPLLCAGGKPLIVWQIEQLAAAGFERIVINHAWLGQQIEDTLGDGRRFGVRIDYSAESEALETAGGIAHARELLSGEGDIFLAVSGDIHTDYDYARLRRHAERLGERAEPGMHLVMVPNPPFHPEGDFALCDGRLSLDPALASQRLTFGNIGLYDLRLFDAMAPGTRQAMTPFYHASIAAGTASGECWRGAWDNIGTPAQLAALDRRLSAAGNPSPAALELP
ncbi:mannose-1-phosphate guanylyltransferase [Pandoraea thiooxydans]|uniref:Mannose-1-phosphate guanylyltransferase n=1 Tax=Pandoraea thiooxydans TaxID=445709 RepID=A0A0G3ESS8_9BURK|nr:nucleotidyltransferase family protein [Pandoraea thiooxydans]AKJ69079.1 mannose-1-phosphate guanylyltransferase [Pandoraea thiooxydans]